MGGKRPKTGKSGKSEGKRNKKMKGAESNKEIVPEPLIPKEPELQKNCLICSQIMIEPCKLQDVWFCQHCIKHVKASNVQNNDDEEDEANKPPPEDAEKPEFKYLDIIKASPNNPVIDVEL
jgi:hypothetical protein